MIKKNYVIALLCGIIFCQAIYMFIICWRNQLGYLNIVMDYVAVGLSILTVILSTALLYKGVTVKGIQVAATSNEGLSEIHLSLETPLIDTIEGSGQEQHLVFRTKISLPSRDQDSGLESLVVEYLAVTPTSIGQPDYHRAIYCTEDHPFGTHIQCCDIGRSNIPP